jgi:hypothetical protein
VKTATNKRLLISESRGNSNRCTPYMGKSDTHDMYASHASLCMPHVRFLWVVHIRGNLSQAINSVWRTLLLLRKGFPTQPPQLGWVIRGSTTQFLSQHSHWSSNESQTFVDSRILGLPGPYHQHAIDTFNTYSREPTHRSLTDTSEGYSLGGAGLPHTTPGPSQPMVSTFHLRAPPSLKLSNININL